MFSDISVHIGIDDIVRGRFPNLDGLLEFIPILDPIHGQAPEIARRSWIRKHGPQRQRAMSGRVFPKDGTMPREFQVHHLVGLTFDVKRGLLNFHRVPAGLRFVTQWIGRIERLNVQVLLIHAEDRPAKAHALVVPTLHAR